MKTTRWTLSFLAGLLATLLAALLLAPAAGAQTLAERAREAKKKKEASTRKVWTNDDLRRLEGSFGFNVVGTSLQKPEEAAPGQAPEEPKNFYSDLSLDERQQWIDKLEAENAKLENQLVNLRTQLYAASSDEDRARLNAQIEEEEQAVEQNRAELELIRKTPPPKPGQKPKPASEPPAPQKPAPPSF